MPSAFASSLIATTEISARRPDSYSARNTLRPMRPKPFIAMRMVMLLLKRAVPAGLTHRRRAGADWLSH